MQTAARPLLAGGDWTACADLGFSGTALDKVSATAWMTGSPKAAVLPLQSYQKACRRQRFSFTRKTRIGSAPYLPVSAAPMTSPPPRMRGMASAWMGVGSSHPMASTARISSGCTGARHATVDCTRRALCSGSVHLQTELLVRAHIVQQHKHSGSPRYVHHSFNHRLRYFNSRLRATTYHPSLSRSFATIGAAACSGRRRGGRGRGWWG